MDGQLRYLKFARKLLQFVHPSQNVFTSVCDFINRTDEST